MDDIIYSKHLQIHERLGGPRQYYDFLYLNPICLAKVSFEIYGFHAEIYGIHLKT